MQCAEYDSLRQKHQVAVQTFRAAIRDLVVLVDYSVDDQPGDVEGRNLASSLAPKGEITVSPKSSTRYKLKAARYWAVEGPPVSYVTLDVVPAPEQPTSGAKSQPTATPKQQGTEGTTGGSLTPDKILAFIFGVFFAVVLLFIAYKDRDPTDIGKLIYRSVLALVAAGIGAVIPGVISVNQPIIRAGGAIALFVVVYWFNPPKLVANVPDQQPTQTGPDPGA